jgi:hypothetical protein
MPKLPDTQFTLEDGAFANLSAKNRIKAAGIEATKQRPEATAGKSGETRQLINPMMVIGATKGSASTLAAIE